MSDEKQCRICLDGPEAEQELGRLIRPCLCKGSISYVHIRCLQRWRNTSASNSAFFSCPQCHYRYRFARTRIAGLGTNPVVVGSVSAALFTVLTLFSSYITTYTINTLSDSPFVVYSYSPFYVSPLEVVRDLVRAVFRILEDDDVSSILDDSFKSRTGRSRPATASTQATQSPTALKAFVTRFLIGLPLIGAGSLVQMLLSLQILAPVHWLARYRGNRRRNNNSRDITAFIVVLLVLLGAARALYKVYQATQSLAQRILLRAEDAILEV